jgi:hypothetical protein
MNARPMNNDGAGMNNGTTGTNNGMGCMMPDASGQSGSGPGSDQGGTKSK